MRIDGSRVLLTGATGGLGRAIAKALHERGAHLILSGRKQEALDALCAELGGDRCESLAADLAVRADVDALPGRAGRVDILVHNAGLPGNGRIEAFTPEELDRVLDVNLRAGVQLTRALMPAMVERGSGQLVFMSSIAGKVPTARAAIYSATKYGLRGFAGAVRDDLHGTGVGVSVIFPGIIEEAGMWGDAGMKTPKGVPRKYPKDVGEAVVKAIEKNIPELDIADPIQRIGGVTAALMPKTAARLRRLVGIQKFGDQLAERTLDKR